MREVGTEVGQPGARAYKAGGGEGAGKQDGLSPEEAAAVEEEAWGWAAHGGYEEKGPPCNRALLVRGEGNGN